MPAPLVDGARTRVAKPVAAWRVWTRRSVMAAAALGIFAVAFAQVAHSEQGSGSVDYTVRPGDSVWSIAAERYPSADTRAKVGEILAANGMASPVLASGEHLKLPQS